MHFTKQIKLNFLSKKHTNIRVPYRVTKAFKSLDYENELQWQKFNFKIVTYEERMSINLMIFTWLSANPTFTKKRAFCKNTFCLTCWALLISLLPKPWREHVNTFMCLHFRPLSMFWFHFFVTQLRYERTVFVENQVKEQFNAFINCDGLVVSGFYFTCYLYLMWNVILVMIYTLSLPGNFYKNLNYFLNHFNGKSIFFCQSQLTTAKLYNY